MIFLLAIAGLATVLHWLGMKLPLTYAGFLVMGALVLEVGFVAALVMIPAHRHHYHQVYARCAEPDADKAFCTAWAAQQRDLNDSYFDLWIPQ